jgi:uncharacterized protein YqeY
MALVDDLAAQIALAMRQQDRVRLSALRMLKTALTNREVEKGRHLDEAESQQVVSSLVKQRKDSIEQFSKAGRQDLADRETAELEILQTYLPPPLDGAAIERTIDEVVAETGASSPGDLGRVMKAVMAKLAGLGADGKTVNELVRKRLSSR